jgi:hydrogenase maturation protease
LISETVHGSTLLLGLGNPILGDDGVGCSLAGLIEEKLGCPEGLSVLSVSVSPVRLVDIISKYDRLILVDSITTGQGQPGELFEIDLSDEPHLPASAHHFSAGQIPGIAEALGLPCPGTIRFYGIEIEPPREYGDRLSDRLRELLPSLAEQLIQLEFTDFIGDGPDGTPRGEQAV